MHTTIVIVSDYGPTTAERTWDDERRTLAALGRQPGIDQAEVFYVEGEDALARMPADVRALLPRLRLHASTASGSYALKNEAITLGTGDIVVLLDADCAPREGWLEALLAPLADPRVAAVSGRTVYPGDGVVARCLTLIDRAYVDLGGNGPTGPTHELSNNNCAIRRELLRAHPLPTGVGAFASRLHANALRAAGLELVFAFEARVEHGLSVPMVIDMRRELGRARLANRRVDRALPGSRLARLGVAAVPPMVLIGMARDAWALLRKHRRYGVSALELPIALSLSQALRLLEVPGLWSVATGRDARTGAYR